MTSSLTSRLSCSRSPAAGGAGTGAAPAAGGVGSVATVQLQCSRSAELLDGLLLSDLVLHLPHLFLHEIKITPELLC